MMYAAEIGKELFWNRYYVPESLHWRVVTPVQKKRWDYC